MTEGYGILQPRIGIAVQSAARSRLASIYSGQNGFDIYTRAISDAYQDLFGEGIFTGKGIYEISTLHAVLDRRFPRNALLSHDLIEGAYARAGQVTDVELIDDYPSHYSAYSRRKHRWVRGDWQIAQWMFSHVPDESGKLGPNPISYVSRWKIFDNLRRSLLDPAMLILFVAGWLGLPGGPLYWTLPRSSCCLFRPSCSSVFHSARDSCQRTQTEHGRGICRIRAQRSRGIAESHLPSASDDARPSTRSSGPWCGYSLPAERLLEWETAAQVGVQGDPSGTPSIAILRWTPFVAVGLAVLVYFAARQKDAIYIAAPILLLWAVANLVTAWLNKPPQEQQQRLSHADHEFPDGPCTAHLAVLPPIRRGAAQLI